MVESVSIAKSSAADVVESVSITKSFAVFLKQREKKNIEKITRENPCHIFPHSFPSGWPERAGLNAVSQGVVAPQELQTPQKGLSNGTRVGEMSLQSLWSDLKPITQIFTTSQAEELMKQPERERERERERTRTHTTWGT